MSGTAASYVASADIRPSRFVKISGNNTVAECVANDQAIGISDESTELAPIPGAAVLAASSGNACRVYGLGEQCEVIAGGTVTAGQYLKPDANGLAVACSATNIYSAIARTGGTVNQRLRVEVARGVAT